ncbi:MAG: AraC family transcriptional regulator [Cyclobacteriaceae bacterium]
MFETKTIQQLETCYVQDIQIIKAQESLSLRIPENFSELYIPIDGDLTFQCIGQARKQLAKMDKGYFYHLRPRGLELNFVTAKAVLLIKIDPLFLDKVQGQLKIINSVLSEFRLKKESIRNLYKAALTENRFYCQEVLDDLIDEQLEKESNSSFAMGAELIKEAMGQITVKEIYENLCVSKSKLEQDFLKSVGLTPKEFCKIEKLKNFVTSYYNSAHLSLTELTYKCGYYDQSHLIKDFNYFLDISPKRFFERAENSVFANS